MAIFNSYVCLPEGIAYFQIDHCGCEPPLSMPGRVFFGVFRSNLQLPRYPRRALSPFLRVGRILDSAQLGGCFRPSDGKQTEKTSIFCTFGIFQVSSGGQEAVSLFLNHVWLKMIEPPRLDGLPKLWPMLKLTTHVGSFAAVLTTFSIPRLLHSLRIRERVEHLEVCKLGRVETGCVGQAFYRLLAQKWMVKPTNMA